MDDKGRSKRAKGSAEFAEDVVDAPSSSRGVEVLDMRAGSFCVAYLNATGLPDASLISPHDLPMIAFTLSGIGT